MAEGAEHLRVSMLVQGIRHRAVDGALKTGAGWQGPYRIPSLLLALTTHSLTGRKEVQQAVQ